MRVLVIDDSRAIRMILKKTLKSIGAEVVEAGHGAEALEQLQGGEPFDLALVDWNMPEMNGYEFVKAVRKEDRYASMKLCMVTTETETAQVVKALEAGADEYIMKPFTKEALQDKLNMLGVTA
ncbi:MAG TPA: response regulator [Candidatus Krumholzibacteria bacterium]|nr:response regulator [Candidatus Krumholzibacteria bacterium]